MRASCRVGEIVTFCWRLERSQDYASTQEGFLLQYEVRAEVPSPFSPRTHMRCFCSVWNVPCQSHSKLHPHASGNAKQQHRPVTMDAK